MNTTVVKRISFSSPEEQPDRLRTARYLIDDAFSRLSRSEDASMLCDISKQRKVSNIRKGALTTKERA